MNISVRFQYKIEDFKELVESAQGKKVRRYRVMYLLLGLAVIAVPFINGYTNGDGFLHPHEDALPLIILGLMLLIGGTATQQWQLVTMYQPCVNGTECEATIDDNRIITTTPNTRNEMKWEAFSCAIHAPNVVALVLQSVMYAFPKRAFSDEQWAEFMEQIKKRVGDRDPSLHESGE